MKESNLEFCFNGIVAELQTWFNQGTDDQKELLIESLRECSDLIDSDMPAIDCEPEPKKPDFQGALSSFLAGCQLLIDKNNQCIFKDNPEALAREVERGKLEAKIGPKFCKVVTNQGGSVYCFISKENGDVFKPASWKAPAKHARGNIFDAHNGLKYMGCYGPAYLR